MRNADQTNSTRSDRHLGSGTATAVIVFLLCASVAQGFDHYSYRGDGRLRTSRAGLSLFDIELPLDFKARFDGLYTQTRYSIDALAYNQWLNPGPAVQQDSLIESRISIGREIWDGVELEVAWATQSPFSFRSISGPDRQTVGAFVRFSH